MLALMMNKSLSVPRIIKNVTSLFPRVGATVSLLDGTATMQQARTMAIDLQDARLNKLPPTGSQTKVVCTLGPSTDKPEMIHELVQNGMNVARLNFSHAGSDYTYPKKIV